MNDLVARAGVLRELHRPGTPLVLRNAELDELLQLRVEAGLADGAVEAKHRAVELGRGLFDVDA